jgi:hypothetical protein
MGWGLICKVPTAISFFVNDGPVRWTNTLWLGAEAPPAWRGATSAGVSQSAFGRARCRTRPFALPNWIITHIR